VRGARLGEEVAVHAVGPEGHPRAECRDVGVADGVLQVAARVVDDPGSGFSGALPLGAGQVDSVGENRLWPDGAGALQSLEGAGVAAVLGDVDMEPRAAPAREIRRGFDRLVGGREPRVQADHRGQSCRNRALALGEARLRALPAVAVGRPVAESGPDPYRARRLGEDIE